MVLNSTEDLLQSYLEAIESELQQAVKRADDFGYSRLYEMLAYHMGWEVVPTGTTVKGKRFRPLLVLLSCEAAGGDWKQALPAATAVELVHNFSLIHDDIEDRSPLRRGRPTVWKEWGIPQAINSGDAMFALAHLEAIRLSTTVSPSVAMQAVDLLQNTCLHLTQGQFLDLWFETRNDLSLNDYWHMVEGKTAVLMATSAELGALSALGDHQICNLYRKFGHSLGLAFQVQDDYLGLWGKSILTGKSSQSDLVTRKITLPVLYGLSKNGKFATRWKQAPIPPDEVLTIINLLESEGGKEYTELQAKHFIDEALSTLEEAHPSGTAGELLRDMTLNLVNRQT